GGAAGDLAGAGEGGRVVRVDRETHIGEALEAALRQERLDGEVLRAVGIARDGVDHGARAELALDGPRVEVALERAGDDAGVDLVRLLRRGASARHGYGRDEHGDERERDSDPPAHDVLSQFG